MRVATNIPIQDLVKRNFRETYGVEDDTLYQNVELHDKIRDAVKALRRSLPRTFGRCACI